MPLERPNHYGHLLDKRNRIEGDDVRARRGLIQGAPEQPIKTVFFPNVNEVLIRRQQAREALAARVTMSFIVAGLIYWAVTGDSFGGICAGFNFVGFIVVCFVAGNRVNRRRLGHEQGQR